MVSPLKFLIVFILSFSFDCHESVTDVSIDGVQRIVGGFHYNVVQNLRSHLKSFRRQVAQAVLSEIEKIAAVVYGKRSVRAQPYFINSFAV